ncbi:M14 family metallocarboxypeptidase [Fictibacillus sp. WQ 8-8]|uniref:M14 family metallopeptidase n=1 Tax=Fictibacillus sp. WQ 8-8 TaxID=2938788 RepID=UPI00210D6E9F|nr:M14 family metallocarboxypeptidase [Fictibacillus sp. WQ 8-8]MCQ6267516.1 M14 family metallocarboxypeptidase [Fictibacillus sp. WQ 8-8]
MKNVLRSTSFFLAMTLAAGLYSSSDALPKAAAADETEKFTPYYGYGPSYVQPSSISYLFPKPAEHFSTPAFEKGRLPFTSQEEMLAFIKKLDHKNKLVTLKSIGKSLEGRDLPILLFSKENPDKIKNNKKKPLIWIQGQIHGNEPAAGESVLVTAQKLAQGKMGNVLDKVNVAIVPRVNPDGSYYFKRQIATNLDANRDYMKVEYPEVQAVHKAVNEYKPDVVLDAHEYTVNSPLFKKFGEQGSVSSYDLLISSAKNLNIPKQLRKTSDNLVLNKVKQVLDQRKLSHHDYYTLDTDDDGQLVATEGSTETRIGRNALGLKNTLTYLIETRGINIGRADFNRRVYAQATAQENFIKTTAADANKIKTAVKNARQDVINKGKEANDKDTIVIKSENKRVPDQQLEVVDLAQAKKANIPIVWEDSTDAYPTLERERPTAYIMPPAYHSIARKLETLGVNVQKLQGPVSKSVERYKVTGKKVSTTLENGHYTNEVTTDVKETVRSFPAGSYVFSMGQPNANFIALALEPESVDSYVTFNFIPTDVGDELPIYRYLSERKLNAK